MAFVKLVIHMFAGPPGTALLTSRSAEGEVVPIPTLPLEATRNREALPVMKLIDPSNWLAPFLAMLLIRYSWVTLLKPWN
jgi:hypothetical protein